jgi:hypothetical protein
MFKAGDIVRITQGVGRVKWIRNRKAPKDGNPNNPLMPVPDRWELAVQIRNPSSSLFAYYTHNAFLEYTHLATAEELDEFNKEQKNK